MASYKVSYFPAKGNGEILRLLFVAADKQFEDERLPREEWMKIKPNTPTKQMPMLTVTEKGKKTVYAQTGAISRYLARKFGLFGKTPEEELLVDEANECIAEVQREVMKVIFEKDETKKTELKEKLQSETIPRLNDYINLRTKDCGQKGFIIGASMTLADLQLFNLVDQVSGYFEGLFTADLKKHADFVKSDKKVAEWIKKSAQSSS